MISLFKLDVFNIKYLDMIKQDKKVILKSIGQGHL